MSEETQTDLQAFQVEVIKFIDVLQRGEKPDITGTVITIAGSAAGSIGTALSIGTSLLLAIPIIGLGTILGGVVGAAIGKEVLSEGQRKREKQKAEIEKKEDAAKEFVKRKDVRHYLCPALHQVTDDVYEVAKTIIPILLPLALTKTLPIPPDPLSFALIAIVIARMGIASLCVDFDKKEPEKVLGTAGK